MNYFISTETLFQIQALQLAYTKELVEDTVIYWRDDPEKFLKSTQHYDTDVDWAYWPQYGIIEFLAKGNTRFPGANNPLVLDYPGGRDHVDIIVEQLT